MEALRAGRVAVFILRGPGAQTFSGLRRGGTGSDAIQHETTALSVERCFAMRLLPPVPIPVLRERSAADLPVASTVDLLDV